MLKVTDTKGASSTAALAVVVTTTPNSAPNAVATAGVTSGNAPLASRSAALGRPTPTATR